MQDNVTTGLKVKNSKYLRLMYSIWKLQGLLFIILLIKQIHA